MNDDQLLRYSRHILLDEIGIDGQQNLLDSHAVVIGAGGLGCPAALYLASAGVGRITLIDHDTVDLTNLQRQIAHTESRVGQSKVESLKSAMQSLNSSIDIQAMQQKADAALLNDCLADAHVVLDCSDNFETRHLINAICVKHAVPLVSGSAVGLDGQLSVYDPKRDKSPCYACLFPPDHAPPAIQCSLMGILSPLTGIIGTMQALEALKCLTKCGDTLVGRLALFDARRSHWHEIRFGRQTDCSVCAPSVIGHSRT